MNINSSLSDNSTNNDSFHHCDSTASDCSFYSISDPLSSLLENKFNNFPKNFNVVHINAQSLPAHYPDLLDSFNLKSIHAILVSETFLKPGLPSTAFPLPGFHLIRNDRTEKGGGGVAIYLRNHFPFSILHKSPSAYSNSSEHILIEVLFGTLKVLLGVFYSPNLHINYFDAFEDLLERYAPGADHSIIMGDFNTCLLKNDYRTNRLQNIINSANLNILPTNATHSFPGCAPSLLDLMIVSSTERVATFGQMSADAFSYHDLVYLSYKIRPPKLKPTVVMRRCFNNIDNEKFMNDLASIDWDCIFCAGNINDKLNIFNSILTELFDIHAPLRPVKIKHLPAPWLTPDIKLLMSKRNTAKSKYKKNPTDANLQRYKTLRNRCNKTCRDARRNFILSSIDNSNPAKTWKFLNAMGIGGRRANDSATLNNCTDLDSLNTFFTTVNVLANSTKAKTLYSLSLQSNPAIKPFLFSPVSLSEVRKHVLSIKSDATGFDNISRRMILLTLNSILPVLCHIYNFSLSCDEFPDVWRHAVVIPIPKVPNPASFSNYRPISILPFLSKVLERIVHEQIYLFLHNNNILSPFQSGFRPGHSTVTALNKVCDDIRYGFEHQQVTLLVLLDFSNAFNTVDFDVLLAILRSINFSSKATEWFSSYLHGRRQSIKLDGKASSICCINAGVPQGSVLSPLLFSIFINTLTQHISSSYHLYADDLQIYTTAAIRDIPNAINKINSDLQIISSWSKSFGLSINPNKSQVCIFGSSKQLAKLRTPLPSIFYDNVCLEVSESVKNLGIRMDGTFCWSPHVSELSRKVFSTIGRLRRWKNVLPLKTKISLAHALLLPILDYADSCYLDLSQQLLNKLERLQNLIIRFIFGLRKHDHVSQYRSQLKWLPIEYRRNLHALTLLYAILSKPVTPSYLKDRFKFLGSDTLHSQNLRSRHNYILEIPLCRTKCYSDSFTVKTVKLWNELPLEVRRSQSTGIFKRRLKQYYLKVNS